MQFDKNLGYVTITRSRIIFKSRYHANCLLVDIHHCHCITILNVHFDLLRKKLESNGFKDGLQFQNGQLYGLIKKINEDEQIHIKLMPSGLIEAEIEPSQDYPFAHLNQKHCYPAHNQLVQLLNQFGIPYVKKWGTPLWCMRPVIVKPISPTPMKIVLGTVAVLAIVGGVALALSKSKN